jgi:murein DD-endopeptidase MepM/ murein hydrolase activator NlpD
LRIEDIGLQQYAIAGGVVVVAQYGAVGLGAYSGRT